jgi:hypothetical protein
VDADVNNLAGYFTLTFSGETTNNIPWNANAQGAGSVASHLARLSTVGAVEVTRQMSRRVVQGVRVNVTKGHTNATLVDGSTSALSKGDVIWISNLMFTIQSVTSGTPGIIHFANSVSFTTASVANAKVYKWSYGYSWDVTFTSLIGDIPKLYPASSDNWAGTNPVVKVVTAQQGVNPLSGTFRVGFRGTSSAALPFDIDAVGMKVALEQLDTIGQVDVARYPNGFGYDWEVTFLSELGDVPEMYVNKGGLQGPFAQATVVTSQHGSLPDNYASKTVAGGLTDSTVVSGLTREHLIK